MTKKNKFDEKAVKKNKNLMREQSFENARKHQSAARILADNGFYSFAHFHVITALEEIAKASLLNSKVINTELLNRVTNHTPKIREVIGISAQTFNVPITENYVDSLSERLVNMREDSLYTRLKDTHNNQFSPDDKYWKKRYNSYSIALDKMLKTV